MNGFELFGKEHIGWLIFCAACVAAVWAASARKRVADHPAEADAGCVSPRLTTALGAAAVLTHLLESGWRIAEGSYGIDTLPLHICAISTYLVLIHMIRPNRIAGELLFCPGIAGALCALLFPDWTMYAPFSVLSIAGFLSHLAIILYTISAIRTGLVAPSIRRVWIPVIFLAVYAAVMIPFDKTFGVNYGFLNGPSAGSVLEWLAGVSGMGAGYYAGYALIVLAGILVSYGIDMIISSCLSRSR